MFEYCWMNYGVFMEKGFESLLLEVYTRDLKPFWL
jgi:hypothetical protein